MQTIYVHGEPVEINADMTVYDLKKDPDAVESDIAVYWSDAGALLLKDTDQLLDHMPAALLKSSRYDRFQRSC